MPTDHLNHVTNFPPRAHAARYAHSNPSPTKMKNTLLLVFIHGFKGNDHTFHAFPKDLRALIAHTLPKINVVSVQYPQYETKGDLRACVSKFKEWCVEEARYMVQDAELRDSGTGCRTK